MLFDQKSPVHWEAGFPNVDIQTDIQQVTDITTYRLNRPVQFLNFWSTWSSIKSSQTWLEKISCDSFGAAWIKPRGGLARFVWLVHSIWPAQCPQDSCIDSCPIPMFCMMVAPCIHYRPSHGDIPLHRACCTMIDHHQCKAQSDMGQQEMVSGPATEGRSSTLKAHQPILEKGSTVLLLQLLLLLLLLLRHAQGTPPWILKWGGLERSGWIV